MIALCGAGGQFPDNAGAQVVGQRAAPGGDPVYSGTEGTPQQPLPEGVYHLVDWVRYTGSPEDKTNQESVRITGSTAWSTNTPDCSSAAGQAIVFSVGSSCSPACAPHELNSQIDCGMINWSPFGTGSYEIFDGGFRMLSGHEERVYQRQP